VGERDPSDPEIVLVQKLPIDRESKDIMDVDGKLKYEITVTDAAGNFETTEVSLRPPIFF
jgi:hypothetical protein